MLMRFLTALSLFAPAWPARRTSVAEDAAEQHHWQSQCHPRHHDNAGTDDITVQRWRFGMMVTAVGGPCNRLVGTTTVPMDWPEQRVKVVGEDLSPGVTVSYKPHGTTAKQMVVKIPHLEAGEEAKAVVTFEIRRSAQLRRRRPTASWCPTPRV